MDQRKKSNSNRKGFTFNLFPRLNFTCHIILLPDILNIKYYFHRNPYWHHIIFGILLLFFSRLFLFAIFCLLFVTVIKILCSSCFFGFRQWSCSRSNFRIYSSATNLCICLINALRNELGPFGKQWRRHTFSKEEVR